MEDADIYAWQPGQNVMLRLIRAIVAGCKAEPSLNAWYDSQRIGRYVVKKVDLGIAVDTPDGLLVPVLRNVESRIAPLDDKLEPALEASLRRPGQFPAALERCRLLAGLP